MRQRAGAPAFNSRVSPGLVARAATRSIPSRFLSGGRVLRGSLKRRMAPRLDVWMGLNRRRELRRARRNMLPL